MSDKKIIPVSVNDKKLIEFLKTKDNVSAYIRDLIKNDMDKCSELSDETKQLIDKYIKSKLCKSVKNNQKNKPC